ncbi:Uncharacterized protein AArcCO_1608 [Halalkaliarchaeum sp. AArc-CO]|uniref:hypothetical protein n=1 Tax=unclassified Halalkaliarchaeum TaxID=2678344 RepID=UPI00217DD0FE|nr:MULTISPECIES: hypothetical protein [unclassified Halalkaliarchaeum]MDR5674192.1 hypothetical protein [Halalkaliarchaeum sp. AArc-GB]UWG50910.1 Uncharacterized protein AArcCO_1608 [Halalkaliarchaeum sp. AArc-CO]
MVPSTGSPQRRDVLRWTAGLLAVPLAGCLDAPESSDSESDIGPDPENVITDVTVLSQRLEIDIDRGEQIVTYDESHDDAEGQSLRLPYVIDSTHVGLLEFSRELPDPGRVEEFLQKTEYDDASVLIEESSVSACRRNRLQYVHRRSSGSRLAPQFCSTMRDPAVDCSADENQYQITFIRVPVPFESPPSGSGRGWSSRCELPPDHPASGAKPIELGGDHK